MDLVCVSGELWVIWASTLTDAVADDDGFLFNCQNLTAVGITDAAFTFNTIPLPKGISQ
jgi:hypothetical protein